MKGILCIAKVIRLVSLAKNSLLIVVAKHQTQLRIQLQDHVKEYKEFYH
jgi:hypothetical protein